jgi:hypothetical protein
MENETGTIQQDVSSDGSTQDQQRPLTARELMFEQIGNKIDEERQGQEVEGGTIETTDQAGKQVVDDLQMLVRVKINGKEEERPLAEVLTGYQKNEAASERLRLAAAKEKDLAGREKALNDQIQLQGQLSTEADTGDDDDLDQALNAIVEGNTDAAKQALRNAINKGRAPVTTPQAIDEDALAQRIEQKQEVKKDWDTFLKANPEFADDKSKERQYGDYLFNTKYAPLIEAGEISYHQALLDTANEVKSTLTQPAATKTPREIKLERKQSIDSLPIAAGARQTGAAAEQEETHGDIITQMRKGRNLPV